MKSEISRNRKLRKRVEHLEEELQMSQEQISIRGVLQLYKIKGCET